MKLSKETRQKYSDAIDKMTEGLDEMVELYNSAEDEKPMIRFEDEVAKTIEKAKSLYGDQFVDAKINALIKDVLSFVPLDQVGGSSENE